MNAQGYTATKVSEVEAACDEAFAARRPALVNVIIDPASGRESGSVHDFNEPRAKM